MFLGCELKPFRWGIFGTGAIADKFVSGLGSAQNAQAAFVASRSLDRARQFASRWRIDRAIEGYAAAAAEGGVDAVYIATPPSEHAAHAVLCIEAGIPVLVEKPFASTAAGARSIRDAARNRSVFAMEAMWTRFLPAAQALRERVLSGAAGQVRFVTGNFGSSQIPDPHTGIFNPSTGGGALAHLGSYPLSLGQWLFGAPTLVQATGTIGSTGVDEDVAFQLRYPGGTIGAFFVSARAWAPDDFQVLGTHGMVRFRGSIVRPYGIAVSREEPIPATSTVEGWRGRLRQHPLVHRAAQHLGRSSRGQGRSFNFHYSGNGYNYEADEVRSCVGRGLLESAIMPLDDSIEVAQTMDEVARAIGKQASLEAGPA